MTVMMRASAFSTMPIAHKAALTGFLLLALIHLFVVSVGMALLHSGTSAQSIREHYAGNEHDPSTPIEDLKAQKSVIELLTITHSHVAVMPVFTFLLCHILAMASRPGLRIRIVLIIIAYISVAIEISVPWLALHEPSLAFLRHISRAGMVVTNLVSIFVPLAEMWFVRRS